MREPRVNAPANRFVLEAYDDEKRVLEALANVWRALNVLAVYTLGMVVEAWM